MNEKGSSGQWILLAAILAGGSYLIAVIGQFDGLAAIIWKGSGVALLALYAALNAENSDGWLLAAVMAFGAAGDVLLDSVSLEVGAGAFAAGHIIAICLYLRNRRRSPTGSQQALAVALAFGTPIIAWALTQAIEVLIYATLLGVMAAMAWLSRFPRYRVGLGAVFFVASDLLIFARMGPLAEQAWIGVAIWSLYSCGQLLIVLGVTGTHQRSAQSSIVPQQRDEQSTMFAEEHKADPTCLDLQAPSVLEPMTAARSILP
jgi:uncharacterized membrane protein YhhN